MIRVLLACLIVLSACTTIRSQAIVPDITKFTRTHVGVVLIQAEGRGPVSDKDLGEGVLLSIEASSLFDRAILEGDSDWVLSVQVVEINQPEWSIDMRADVTMRWQLHHASGKLVWTKRIETKATKGPDDAEPLGTRAKMATTQAIIDNLEEALEHMSELSLAP